MSAPSSVLLGPDAERARVQELLVGTQAGRAGALLILGVPGVGKTRLLGAAIEMAEELAMRTARVACLPLTTPLPFDPLLALLRGLEQPVDPGIRDSPRELFGIALERLERASLARPLLLCVDDLQWSDAATVDLIQYCLARLSDLPIAWLLTARSGRAQAALVHRFERDGLVARLELATLDREQTRRLCENLLAGRETSDQLVEIVYERTGGNPFLCVELLRALVTPHHETSDPLTALVPPTIGDAIEARIARLSAAAGSALSWAALLPEPFTFEELERVAGPRAAATPELLADANFLRADEEGRWRFAHMIVRDAVYARLSGAERVRRHSVVADALADGPEERRAPQLELAHRWSEAARAFLRLGGAALRRGEGEDAAAFCGRAVELAATAGDERVAREAQGGVALALLRAGRWEQARDQAQHLRARLRGAGDVEERLRFLSLYATALIIYHDSRDVAAAREVLDEAEALIGQARGLVLARVLAASALVAQQAGNAPRALAAARQAEEIAAREGDVELRVHALVSLGLAVGIASSPREGTAILERAAQIAADADLPAEAGRAGLNLAHLAELAGDPDAALRYAGQGLLLEGAPAAIVALLHCNAAEALRALGDLDAALAHLLAATRQAERAGPYVRSSVAEIRARIHLHRGELAAARRLLESHPVPAESIDALEAAELEAAVLEREGKPAQALRRYQNGVGLLADSISARCLLGIVRTGVALGELDPAREAFARLRAPSQRWGMWMYDAASGWIAVAENRTAEAIGHLRAAARTCPILEEATRLRLDAARLARDRGEILEVIAIFEGIRALSAADEARAVARQLGMRPGRRRRRTGVLSAREQEIAQLVAAGQTNAEIAAALFLSQRTVEHHVSSILTKLRCRSRVQLAAAAAAGRLPGAAGSGAAGSTA